MLWLDQRFAAQLASRLRNYKRTDSYVSHFSCPSVPPFCGDVSKVGNTRKASAYFYRRGSNLMFKCHRCGESKRFDQFLRILDEDMYGEYIAEKNLGSGTPPRNRYDYDSFRTEVPVVKADVAAAVPLLKTLPGDAVDYLRGRMIPDERIAECRWTEDFFLLAATLFPPKYAGKTRMSRLVIPVRSADGSLVGIQGADITGQSRVKYITCAPDGASLVYGIERVGEGTIYALEGPWDSTFLPNGVATLGGTMTNDLLGTGVDPSRFVVVYDNEPRSNATVKKVEKAIAAGFRVCVWPLSLREKDVNDMVLAGMSPAQVKYVIDKNTHGGLDAEIALSEWRRA